jgi:ribonuclease HII
MPTPASSNVLPDRAFDAAAARRAARRGGSGALCGVDEAGRGPLAGPVAAAAVVLHRGARIDGLDDSKQLTAEAREALYLEIMAKATVAVAFASALTIDRLNIRGATLWAMLRAVRGLGVVPALILIDGRDVPEGLAATAEPVIGGDALSPSIAAASIVAKVTRDRLMCRLGALLPDYGFEHHKGYATPAHRDALVQFGPTIHHRRSFAPVRCLLGEAAAGEDADQPRLAF